MSQSKVMEETTIMDETNNSINNRIQTRRSSRSTRSASPVMVEEEEVSSPISSVEESTANNTSNGNRVTRSQSVESSGYETADSRKRKRKTKSIPNKKRADSYQPSSHTMKSVNNNNSTPTLPAANVSTSASASTSRGASTNNGGDDSERETRNTTQRMSKEAREAKKAQRDVIIRERLNELDKLEKAVKDGSHSEYHKLLSDIEQKRTKMLYVAEMRRSLAEGNVTNFFNSQKNAAYSQYYWDKLALRRSMIQHVQHKINTLEQEYYSNHVQSSLDDEHLSEWVPPDRPSMISSLTLGLSEEDAENDVEWAKQDPREAVDTTSSNNYNHTQQNQSHPTTTTTVTTSTSQHTNHLHHHTPPPPPSYYRHDTPPQNKRESSPPLDMLASLADRRYQKDFKEEQTEKSFTLPPLHPWRYDQRPTLPT